MLITLPTATEAREEAQRLAALKLEDFRKFTDPHDQSAEAASERTILTGLAVFYYGRLKKFDHTIGAALYDSEESMPYMEYPQAVLQALKDGIFQGKGTTLWRKAHNEWAFSWNDETEV